VARLDSGGGGGGSTDPAEPTDSGTDTDTAQDTTDGRDQLTRGGDEPDTTTTDDSTSSGGELRQSRDNTSTTSDSTTTDSGTETSDDPANPESSTETDSGTDDGGDSPSFRDRIQNTGGRLRSARDRVASGAEAVRERFNQSRTDSQPAEDPDFNQSLDGPEPTQREEQAISQFLQDNPQYSRADIAGAEVNDDGSFSVSFTSSGRETYLEENFQETSRTGEAPQAAGQLQSGDGQDATVVFEQGVEAGEGAVAERAREIEEDILAENPGLDESDVEINLTDDNQFEANLTEAGVEAFQEQQFNKAQNVITGAAGGLSDTAVVESEEPTAQDNLESAGGRPTQGEMPDRLQRADEIGGDATTAADRDLQQAEQSERVRQQVVDQLEAQGVDPADVDITIERTDDGFEASAVASQDEQFGDYAVRIPGIGEAEGAIEESVENAIGTVATPFGANSDEVLGAAATASGVEGRRVENVLGELSGRFQQTVQENAERGGDEVITTALSNIPGMTRESADVTRVALENSDINVGGVNVGESIDEQSEGFFVGAASLADVPGTVVGAKEGAEFATWLGQETASGDGGEAAVKTGTAGISAYEGFEDAVEENPSKVGGQVAGSLAGSVILMGGAAQVSSRAGAVSRYAIQPGEEVLTGAANKFARPAGLGRVVDSIPGGRIDIEEVGILAARRGSRAARAKGEAGLNVGRSAVARARSRVPERSDVVPDRSGNSFFIDQRTGELVEEGTLRPALFDPESSTKVSTAGRPDMVQSFEPEAEPGTTPGSGAAGNNALSGAVEIDMAKDSGMVETSVLEFEGQSETEVIAETKDPFGIEVETEAESEIGTKSRVRGAEVQTVLQDQGISETQTAAEQVGFTADTGVRETQDTAVLERLGFKTSSELNTGLEAEAITETRTPTDTVQEQEVGLESLTEIDSVLETEVSSKSEQELEALFDPKKENGRDRSFGYTSIDDVFDTGVVQSLDELNGS